MSVRFVRMVLLMKNSPSLTERLMQQTNACKALCGEAIDYIAKNEGDEDMAIAYIKAKSITTKTDCSFDDAVQKFYKGKFNKHLITIHMVDDGIDEIITINVKNIVGLKITQQTIERDFQSYDRCEDDAGKFREEGWGTHSFIQYLAYKHDDWDIEIYHPNTTITLLGM